MQAKQQYWHYQLCDGNLSTTVCQKIGIYQQGFHLFLQNDDMFYMATELRLRLEQCTNRHETMVLCSRRSVYRRHQTACTFWHARNSSILTRVLRDDFFPCTCFPILYSACPCQQCLHCKLTHLLILQVQLMWQQSLWMAVFSRGGLKCAEFFLLYVHQGGLLLITFDRPLFVAKQGPSSFDNALMSTMPLPLTFQCMAIKSHRKGLICFQF